ncbi:uncharacterized protein LOC135925367 [Gordionus sp. m RMFG-2023]|uniref:uncharacterized protein LOC135925367 n=1 Tax=Gordionus sp. m RMFG-2023 TaxID=3053472 RepID=UPI0031FD4039
MVEDRGSSLLAAGVEEAWIRPSRAWYGSEDEETLVKRKIDYSRYKRRKKFFVCSSSKLNDTLDKNAYLAIEMVLVFLYCIKSVVIKDKIMAVILCYSDLILKGDLILKLEELLSKSANREMVIAADLKGFGSHKDLIFPYLRTGLNYSQLSYSSRISKSCIATNIPEVCDAIWKTLKDIHMPIPTREHWEKIAQEYFEKHGFPNCLGSLDGKHIRIKSPAKSGTLFYNYKAFKSIVLLGLADSNCKFIYIDVGSYGKQSDGGTFRNSSLYQTNLPNKKLSNETLSYEEYQPRRKKYYNYKLSSARMCIECTFGIATAKFALLSKAIECSVENADKIISTITLLHNIIIDYDKKEYTPNILPITENLGISRSLNASSSNSREIRELFKDYFNS